MHVVYASANATRELDAVEAEPGRTIRRLSTVIT
jgi:hypothetical protein